MARGCLDSLKLCLKHGIQLAHLQALRYYGMPNSGFPATLFEGESTQEIPTHAKGECRLEK
jgi:hypothetical protein